MGRPSDALLHPVVEWERELALDGADDAGERFPLALELVVERIALLPRGAGLVDEADADRREHHPKGEDHADRKEVGHARRDHVDRVDAEGESDRAHDDREQQVRDHRVELASAEHHELFVALLRLGLGDVADHATVAVRGEVDGATSERAVVQMIASGLGPRRECRGAKKSPLRSFLFGAGAHRERS
jgi:hypothetical protein